MLGHRTGGRSEPQHVDGSAEIPAGQLRLLSHHRVTAVAAHHQVGAHLHETLGAVRPHPDDGAVLLHQVGDLRLHPQREFGEDRGVACQEVEEVPLGRKATNRQRVRR